MSFSSLLSPLRKFNRKNLVLFLALLGPGIITANVDNDAGGITTYSLAGAQFGMSLLWMMLPTTVALVVVQEMCARMGAVTGTGLSGLIRESFGRIEVLDFEDGVDKFDFAGHAGVNGFGDLNIVQKGAAVVINDGSASARLVLAHTSIAAVDADDFLF